MSRAAPILVRTFCGIVAVLVGLLVVAEYSPLRRVSHGDDWRRTSTGWEQVSRWKSATPRTVLPPRQNGRQIRIDTHPAVLALIQLVGALFAMQAFPTGSRRLLSKRSSWRTLLTRSFRASAFG